VFVCVSERDSPCSVSIAHTDYVRERERECVCACLRAFSVLRQHRGRMFIHCVCVYVCVRARTCVRLHNVHVYMHVCVCMYIWVDVILTLYSSVVEQR